MLFGFLGGAKKRSINRASQKREPLSRLWFMARGYKQADPRYTKGRTVWLHPHTNDVLGCYGQKLTMQLVPLEYLRWTDLYRHGSRSCYGTRFYSPPRNLINMYY